ncbi:hypothetical protein, partial [Enterococcus sp. ZJ1622]
FPTHLEFIDAFYDKRTSLSGVAFKDTQTGKVTVGFAGTNMDNGTLESLKDISQWGAIAFSGSQASSFYFAQGNEFLKGLKKEGYSIETVTGHSLGGRNGAILGMAYQVPTIIVYNAAPLNNSLTEALFSSMIQGGRNLPKIRLSPSTSIKKIIKDYQGRLVYLISENDPLNNVAGLFGSLYPGEKIVLENGEGHEMNGFLTRKTQAMLLRKLALIDENGKLRTGLQAAQDLTDARMTALSKLEKHFRTAGSGKLTASQEIFLDALSAKTITESMILTTQEKITRFKRMYQENIEQAGELWKQTKRDAAALGPSLTTIEQMSALDEGNATEAVIATQPINEYKNALKKLTNYEKQYTALLEEINQVIDKQVATDKELANHFN